MICQIASTQLLLIQQSAELQFRELENTKIKNYPEFKIRP